MAKGTLNLENSGMTAGGGYLLGKIEWSAAADEAANASNVTAALYVKKGGTATVATTGFWNARLTVGSETAAVNLALTVGTEWVKLAEKTVRIAHSESGSGSCALSGAVTGPQGTLYAGLTAQGGGTAALDAIARASVPSAAASGWKMGQSGTIRTNRKSTKFYHRVRYAFGTLTGQTAGLAKSDGVTDSVAFVPPRSLAAEIPNALSGNCTFTVTTYQDAAMTKQVGAPQSCSARIYVADDMVPRITAFTAEPVSDGVPREWGLWVQGQTCAAWSAAAEAGEGAEIESWQFSMGSAAGSGQSGRTQPLPAGTLTPKLTVRDTRGRSASASLAPVTVEPYALPALSSCSAVRCDSDGTEHAEGTHIRLTCAAAHTALGGRNARTLRWRSRAAGAGFGSWQPLYSGLVAADFAVDASYEIVFSALDTLGGEKRVSLTLPVAAATVHLKSGGRGIGVGKYASEENLLDIAWNTRIDGALTLGAPLPIASGGTGATTEEAARENLGAYPGCVSITESGKNLDDYTTAGWYYFKEAPTGIPGGVNGWLQVANAPGISVIKQLWYRLGTPGTNDYQTWVRTYSSHTGWGSWWRFITADDSFFTAKTLSLTTADQSGYEITSIAAYSRSGMVDVHVQAKVITASSGWLTVATLPAGYRPPVNIYKVAAYYNSASNYANIRMRILPAGSVQLSLGTVGASYAFHDMFITA